MLSWKNATVNLGFRCAFRDLIVRFVAVSLPLVSSCKIDTAVNLTDAGKEGSTITETSKSTETTTGAGTNTQTTTTPVLNTGGYTDADVENDRNIGTDDGGLPPNHCLAGITDYNNEGPFIFDEERSGTVNMYVPNVPAGCKVPMIYHVKDTGTCPMYETMLRFFATHGFLILCDDSPGAGSGIQGIEAFETALSEHPDIADLKFGSTGHFTGGETSFVVQSYAEAKWGGQGLYAGLAMQPASPFVGRPEGWFSIFTNIRGPFFMFSEYETDDRIPLVRQSWVQSFFDSLDDSIEAYFWTKKDTTTIPPPVGEAIEIGVPWFRWKLLDDRKACEAFKAIREDESWVVADEQNELPCNQRRMGE